MKNFFTLIMVVLCAIGVKAQTTEWTFDHGEWGTEIEECIYSETQTIENLTVYATSEKPVRAMFAPYGSIFVGDDKYSRCLRLGGKAGFDEDGAPQYRVLSFDLQGNSDIYIVLQHSSSSGNARTLMVDALIDGVRTNIGSLTVEAGDQTSGTVKYNAGKATTIYIYSQDSSINIFSIRVSNLKPKVTIGASTYSTFCAHVPCQVPAELTAYTAAYNSKTGKVDLTRVKDGIIPAKTGVILKGAAGNYTMDAVETSATSLPDNELVGLLKAHEVTAEDNAYILVNTKNGVQFGKAIKGSTISLGKAYLPIANADAAKLVSMDFDETNGINIIENVENSDGIYYTLSGVKTQKPVKGMLYIHNGKKLIIK